MITKYYAVRDKKAEAFLNPFGARTDGEAIRTFMNAVQDKQSPFYKYPGDFDLYYIADWNDTIGSYVPAVGGARAVITGLEVISEDFLQSGSSVEASSKTISPR